MHERWQLNGIILNEGMVGENELRSKNPPPFIYLKRYSPVYLLTRIYTAIRQPRVLKSNVRLHYYHSCGSYVAHHSLCTSKTARHTCVLKTRTCTPSQSHRVFAGSVQRSNPPTNHFPIRWHQRWPHVRTPRSR